MTYQEFLAFMAQYEQDAYQSSYTGAQIDEGVATARAARGVSGILKGDGAGGISAAAAGTDFVAPSALSPIYSAVTASGSVVTFSAESAGLPIRDMTVSIVPVQSGSGTPSPTNVRPVSGWDAAHIYHSATDGTDTETANKTISFPTTVYHGTLNPITGELTVDKVLFTISGDLIGVSGTVSGSGAKYARTTTMSTSIYINAVIDMCDTYRITTEVPASADTRAIRFNPNRYIYIYDPDFGTLDEIKTALNANPVHVLLRLVNPITYQLSPTEITTLLGENSINADCGDVSVTYGSYLAAANEHTDRVNASLLNLIACIAPTEDGATASQAYAQGAYFFHDGSFCKAKTAIASGAAFTLDTNYQITTVSAAIVALQT